MARPVLIFDVNETLLDVAALDPLFVRLFGNPLARPLWFTRLLKEAFAASMTANYTDFGTLALYALDSVAAILDRELTDDERDDVMQGVLSLPPHSDAPEALDMLRTAGFRLATLTNSAPAALESQLDSAGLIDFFDALISAHPSQRFKPTSDPYHFASSVLRTPMGDLLLVAAHDWDVAGALRAGCQAAFVARNGASVAPSLPSPDIVGDDLIEVAAQLIERFGDGG